MARLLLFIGLVLWFIVSILDAATFQTGIDSRTVSEMQIAFFLLGIAVGYRKRLAWIFALPIGLLGIVKSGKAFSASGWQQIAAFASIIVIVSWVASLTAGLAIGYYVRQSDIDPESVTH